MLLDIIIIGAVAYGVKVANDHGLLDGAKPYVAIVKAKATEVYSDLSKKL